MTLFVAWLDHAFTGIRSPVRRRKRIRCVAAVSTPTASVRRTWDGLPKGFCQDPDQLLRQRPMLQMRTALQSFPSFRGNIRPINTPFLHSFFDPFLFIYFLFFALSLTPLHHPHPWRNALANQSFNRITSGESELFSDCSQLVPGFDRDC